MMMILYNVEQTYLDKNALRCLPENIFIVFSSLNLLLLLLFYTVSGV